MILLEYFHPVIEQSLQQKFEQEKFEAFEETIVDFDGVMYHITSQEPKSIVWISISMKCYPHLQKCGADEILKREYGKYLKETPEPQFDVTLEYNLEEMLDNRAELIKKASMLKRNVFAAPFEKAFKAQQAKENTELMVIPYRDDETVYFRASADRVTVIFSTIFKDETDKIFGKVFLQEFVDARRQLSIQNAPQVLWSNKEPPLELRGEPNIKESDDISYITFVLNPRHFTEGQVREETISRIQLFRDYLHYHIKCSKAYMHTRMRARVTDFLKVLNRAKPEVSTGERKLASGRTFKRA